MKINKIQCTLRRLAMLAAVMGLALCLSGCSGERFITNTIEGTSALLEGLGFDPIPMKSNMQTTVMPDLPELADDGIFRFYRTTLSEEDAAVYDLIRAAVEARLDGIDMTTQNVERLLEIVAYVRYDNPEYFWFTDSCTVTGYERGGTYYITLKLSYNCSEGVQEKYLEEINAVIGSTINKLSGLSDYEKVRGVYEFIINNSSYDENYSDQSCYTLLVKRVGVCAGYTSAANYMLHRLGMQTIYVPGTGRGMEHCWSMVKVNGSWYQLDVTWGDPVTEDGSQLITYTYFLANDKYMKLDHKVDDNIPRLPECRSTGCNYYVWQGRYIDSADYNYISRMLTDAASRREVLEFRCSNSKIFENVCDYLFNNDGMWKAAGFAHYYFPTFDETQLAYSTDELHGIIRLSPVYYTD